MVNFSKTSVFNELTIIVQEMRLFTMHVARLQVTKIKGTLHSKIMSSDLRDFFRRIRWWRSKVKIRTGGQSNRQRKKWHVRVFVTSWCHLAFMQGHVRDSKCSWSAGISLYVTLRSKPITSGWIQDHFAASDYWRLAPVMQYRLRHHPRILAIFVRLFDRVLVRILTSDVHHRTLRKKPTRSEILECSFPLTLCL